MKVSLRTQVFIVYTLAGIILISASVAAQIKIPAAVQNANRRVINNTIISDKLPKIMIAVSDEFEYIGRFPFTIRDVAGGERMIFVDAAENGRVRRLFIAQFEGFFSHVDDFYKYSFARAKIFRGHKFRHNTWAYSNKRSRADNPQNEGVLTEDFLNEKGYTLEDELMMSRFLTVPEEDKKHELILYYLENVSQTNHSIADFYKDNNTTPVWDKISRELTKRSLKSFQVKASEPGIEGGSANKFDSMSLIEGASFDMGTEKSKIPDLMKHYKIDRPELFGGETPRHKVTLSSYYFDKYEVTNKEFRDFLEKNPDWKPDQISADFDTGKYLAHWKNGKIPEGEEDHPVTYVNWYAAMAFCRASDKRLPTEAEWEYAARGGLSDKEYPWGDTLDPTKANYYLSNLGKTTRVGRYPPNGYGIYDTSGNVWEYLADEWGEYDAEPKTNPLAGAAVFEKNNFEKVRTRRVVRGGSWGGSPVNLRVAYRDSHRPNDPQPFVGFRCAASVK